MSTVTHLEVGVDNSQNFLRAWLAWRADLGHPQILHFVAVCGDGFKNTAKSTALKPLAQQLDAQLWGLLPGFHRLVFEDGQVLLTLCLGNVQTLLKQHNFQADTVFIDNLASPWVDSLYTIKAIAKLCRRGTTFAAACSNEGLQSALRQCGFEASSASAQLAVFNPAWSYKFSSLAIRPGSCVVIGAGLAGAAVANSLARRGLAVTVVDAASAPASGASSLPAGLLVPHTSPDDSLLSRLSRAGVRITLQQARARLRHGIDWAHTGVLQRRLHSHLHQRPHSWAQHQLRAANDWCYPATAGTLGAAGLPQDAEALWHVRAGWIKPVALVRAWLATPGVTWRGGVQVAKLQARGALWQVIDKAGATVATADMVVVSAGFGSGLLLAQSPVSHLNAPAKLQAIRGQVTFGLQKSTDNLPPFAINGYGGLVPAITTPEGPMWLMGASYDRDQVVPHTKAQEHADNFARLQTLLPNAAEALADQFSPESAKVWAGIRCATPNRLPLVQRVGESATSPGLWMCTGMGSRGLSFAALCGELLAAHIHGEPLPIESQLAKAMGMKI